MPLPLLGALVVFGIGGLVLLIHFFGWTKKAVFPSDEAAIEAFLTDYPGVEIRGTHLADDRRSALFDVDGGVGFAAPFGEGRLTRLWRSGDIRRVEAGGDGLTLRLADYTAPKVFVALSGDQLTHWKGKLQGMGEVR